MKIELQHRNGTALRSPLLHQNEAFVDIDFIAENHAAREQRLAQVNKTSSPFLHAVAQSLNRKNYYQELQKHLLAESRQLYKFILEQKKRQGRKVFVFSSAYKNEGVATVVLNLIKAFEKAGENHRVLVVDANVKTPGLTRFLGGMALGQGLLDLLAEGCEIKGILQKLVGAEIYFLGHGRKRKNAHEYMTYTNLKTHLARLEDLFDFIIVAAPPLELNLEGYLWGRLADGLILVIHAYRTPLRAIKRIKRRTQRFNASILGTVLNRRQFAIPKFVYEWV
ncbi:MAG: CpsD/CapB family tyrosine-protein kinase [candidate division KSB1 bacterium]|nr:CpsD/CapB family tyrosine-protein kinase [candidate division KSB1 bacterium]